jgi:hypothetical protein
MSKLINYNSVEKDILLELFKNIPMMDKWVACIVESYIYEYVEEYYRNGSLKCIYRTKYGERDGEYKEWWDNGQLKSHVIYKNGKKDGDYKSWYINGDLAAHSIYVNGKIEGVNYTWYPHNILWSESVYVDDVIQSYNSWKENGRLDCSILYKDGKVLQRLI